MALDLTGQELRIAHIYQITFSTGTIMYFTSYGGLRKELPEVGGNFYKYINITRSQIKKYIDLQVDIVEVMFPVHAFTIDTKTIVEAIELGWFDKAEVIISQVDPGNVVNTREVFRGDVSKGVEFDRGKVKLSITSILDVLKTEIPRLIYSEQCNHKLFNSRCGLTKSSFRETGSADASTTTTRIYDAIFAFSNQDEGYWVLGELKMTSGDNSGISRTIRTHADGYVEVYIPFDFTIEVGDTLEAYPGCDKRGSTCDERFSNYINFSGWEYIPRPETLY